MAFDGKNDAKRTEAMFKQFKKDNKAVKESQQTNELNTDEVFENPIFKTLDNGGVSCYFPRAKKITPEMLSQKSKGITIRLSGKDFITLKEKAGNLGLPKNKKGVELYLKTIFNPSKSLKIVFNKVPETTEIKEKRKVALCFVINPAERSRIEEIKKIYDIKTVAKLIHFMLLADELKAE